MGSFATSFLEVQVCGIYQIILIYILTDPFKKRSECWVRHCYPWQAILDLAFVRELDNNEVLYSKFRELKNQKCLIVRNFQNHFLHLQYGSVCVFKCFGWLSKSFTGSKTYFYTALSVWEDNQCGVSFLKVSSV